MGIIRLKEGVRVAGLSPEIVLALQVAFSIWLEYGDEDLIVTSCREGKHSADSKHYKGDAIDLRSKFLGNTGQRVRALQSCLGPDFDVLWERRDTPDEHIHIEWDEKEPRL